MSTLTENSILEYLEKNELALIESIIDFLDIPRSSVNYALKQLKLSGLIKKTKEQSRSTGRPRNLWSLVK